MVDVSTNSVAQPQYLIDPATGLPIAGGGGGGGGGAITGPLGRAADAASVSVALSTEDVALLDGVETVLGATTGAAVVTDANGTIQQYLRGLVTRWVNALGAGTAAAALRTTLASDDPAVATLGATSGAAVITDANGTIQQYLRGIIVKLIAGSKAANASLSVSNSFLTAAALGDGSVTTSAETITVATTVQVVEFFNLSANVIWLNWTGTAVASTTGSFPVPALAAGVAGYYSSPPGASGSLSIIAVTGASAFTCVGWS